MLAIERKNEILSILQDEKKVLVGELSKRFSVSEETIRRDLDKLEKEGYIVKAYGGAVLADNQFIDLPAIVRKNTNVNSKQRIGEIVSQVIHDGERIILDASSTALFIVKHLKEKRNLTILTNSAEILIETADVSGWNIYSTGGLLQEGSLALLGTTADKMISQFQVDKAIISCKGLDMQKGVTDSNEMHANTKSCMLKSANKCIVAVDSSKFDKVAFTRISDLSNIDMVITDLKPSDQWLDFFQSKGIQCIYDNKGE